MKKRILVTGAAGFAASHLIEHVLANEDWEVIGIDSFRHRGDSLRVYHDPARYKIYCADLSAPISDRLMSQIGYVDYIVNAASESHVDRSITDPVPFVENNVKLALNMLEYARKVRPTHFVQVSTDEVPGPAESGVYHREWAVALPSNPYAASKAAQESIAFSYWRTFGVPVVITRTMNMIGERQDQEKFVPMLINRISRGEKVTIHGAPDRIGSRFYLHARNHADAILFLLSGPAPTQHAGGAADRPDMFNVVGEAEMNNLDLANLVADFIGKPLIHEFLDFHSARPGHDFRYGLDGSRIASIGWKAPVSLVDSLKKTITWTLEHPEWLK